MTKIVNNVYGLPVIFPVHPRTAKIFSELKIKADNLHIVDPMGYLEFNYMVKHSKVVITDSGGITEETTVMGIPCITLPNGRDLYHWNQQIDRNQSKGHKTRLGQTI